MLVDGRAASKIMQGVTTEVTGEGSSIAPVNDRLIAEAEATANTFNIAQNWRTLADYFKRLESGRASGDQHGDLCRRGRDPQLRHRQERSPRDAG